MATVRTLSLCVLAYQNQQISKRMFPFKCENEVNVVCVVWVSECRVHLNKRVEAHSAMLPLRSLWILAQPSTLLGPVRHFVNQKGNPNASSYASLFMFGSHLSLFWGLCLLCWLFGHSLHRRTQWRRPRWRRRSCERDNGSCWPICLKVIGTSMTSVSSARASFAPGGIYRTAHCPATGAYSWRTGQACRTSRDRPWPFWINILMWPSSQMGVAHG